MTRDDVIDRAARESKDHRGHLRIWLSGGLLLLGVLALAAAVFIGRAQNDALADKVTALTARADTAEQAVGKLADQVRGLGAVPVAAPGQPGAVGATGATGQRGEPGQTPPCLLTATQCVGAPGKDGQPGQPGTNGVDGQPGQPGKDGANGTDGKDGADGVSVTRQYFDRDADGRCRNFNDFSDGRTRIDEGPAGDAACAPATPPPTTTPSAVLPTGPTLRRRD
ncbi:hypothetical protein [Amycolatopsis plumensis]|uniref:Collagen triple helix repeat-containing protein n=1 Tax=Amycolatopsis plumensis TaxID=236508 RepID=A0ABV5U8I0_9PSEU